jgi:hypothetical protein
MKKLLAIYCLLLIYPTAAAATDWASCDRELTKAQREARDASDHASTLDTLVGDLDSAKEDYESCVQDPGTNDDDGDGCESKKYDYNTYVEEYSSVQSEFNSEFDKLTERLKDLINHCGQE